MYIRGHKPDQLNERSTFMRNNCVHQIRIWGIVLLFQLAKIYYALSQLRKQILLLKRSIRSLLMDSIRESLNQSSILALIRMNEPFLWMAMGEETRMNVSDFLYSNGSVPGNDRQNVVPTHTVPLFNNSDLRTQIRPPLIHLSLVNQSCAFRHQRQLNYYYRRFCSTRRINQLFG